jgi:soluble lytic murein transglycosylase
MKWQVSAIVMAACALGPAAVAAEDDARDAALREQFRAAYAAAAVGLDGDDDEALRAYVLYPYLRAARLERALARAEGAWGEVDLAAAAFVAELGEAPVARALRRAWLASLARREAWSVFLERYEPSAATAALECQRFNARIALGETAGLAAEIRARWLTGRRLPGECEPAFQWLRAQGELPDELVARRVQLLLDEGQASFARVIAARLPRDAATPLTERADFIERPAQMLDALLADPGRDVPVDVVLEAWSRLARSAPQEALERFAGLDERLKGRAADHELAVPLALGLAWDRRPEALEYFARVPRDALDAQALEWLARAAMWAGDWEQVRASIAAMPAARQADWAWRYWTARAAEERDESGAAALYAAALGGDNYYSALAAARLGEGVVPKLEPLPLDAATVASLSALDAFRRVRELTLVGLRDLATEEWRYGYAVLPEEQRLQAIHLAARWEIYDIAVATATSQGVFNDYTLLYPRPYSDLVATAAEMTEVAPQLLYGVMRQESLFRPDAASSAGALGVAQLTRATARETARRWSLPVPDRADLLDPAVNITLGAARVAELLERFDGQLPLALGGYNAGERAVERWLPPRAVDSDVWIENIPYNETRTYVRRVLWHSLVFSWLETGRPQSARGWLGKIDKVFVE